MIVKILLMLLVSSNVLALDLSERDKQLHLGVSTIGSAVFGLATKSPVVGSTVMFGVGMIKEFFDDIKKDSRDDILANGIGCILGGATAHVVLKW